jgi:DNA repair protein RecO (recombination protein O)
VPLIDDDALILDSHPFRERHLIISALTRRHGTLRGVLRGARGGKTPKASATQVLSLVHMSAALSSRAELASIRQVSLLRSSFPLAASLDRAAAAAVVAELLATFCPPGEPAELHFRLGAAVLEGLLEGIEPDTAIAYAQVWTLHLGGVLPPLDRCASCGSTLAGEPRLRAEDGHALCPACAPPGTPELDAAALGWLVRVRRLPVTQVPDPVPVQVKAWLDRIERREAERPVRALDFFRRHGAG